MTTAPRFFIDHLDTPLGRLAIVADATALRAVGWTDRHERMEGTLGDATLVSASDTGGFTSALRAYFEGDTSAIDSLPVGAWVGTPFQRSVWRALRDIPCGETISYGELARRIGNPAAVRAVGLANGANPVGIVVPCHRVIGANGTLTGYGGGIERKRWLLEHEGHTAHKLGQQRLLA
jgi:methylated-DNA-[protein]-cysteine S-methyltransferase